MDCVDWMTPIILHNIVGIGKDKGSPSADAKVVKLEKFQWKESFMKLCEAGKILDMFECLTSCSERFG